MRHSKQSFISIFSSKIKKAPTLITKSRFLSKFHEIRRFSHQFKALSTLSKGARRLLRTFATSEAPLLHPQAFRSTRGASAPQKNAYKQKAPMFCMIHENWGFLTKIGIFEDFFTLLKVSKGARGSCLAHIYPRM